MTRLFIAHWFFYFGNIIDWLKKPVALFLLLLHPPGTLYLLMFNCAKTFSLSDVT